MNHENHFNKENFVIDRHSDLSVIPKQNFITIDDEQSGLSSSIVKIYNEDLKKKLRDEISSASYFDELHDLFYKSNSEVIENQKNDDQFLNKQSSILIKTRKKFKINRTIITDDLKISKDKLSNYESGRTMIPFSKIYQLNSFYNRYATKNEEKHILIRDLFDIPFEERTGDVESIFEKTFNKLSSIDQAKIMERMEFILSSYNNENNIPTKIIPVIGQTACGNPIEAISLTNEYVETNELKASFALIAKGNSMSPLINDGEIILIKQTENVEIGDIGIFQINSSGFSDDEEVTCKMLKSNKPDSMTLTPLNSAYDPIVINKKEISFKVIGKYLSKLPKKNCVFSM